MNMAKPDRTGEPRRTHFQMLRSFVWADLLTFGNASCGMVSLFLCLYYLTEGPWPLTGWMAMWHAAGASTRA